MAKVTRRALNPNASPYEKLHPSPTSHFLVYIPPPRLMVVPPPFYTYSLKLQPAPRKSFALPLAEPLLPKKKNSPLIPVPAGPRIPKSHLKALRSDHAKRMIKWRPKFSEDKPNNFSVVEKLGFGTGRRWKNNRREYQKSLQLEPDTTSLMIKNIPNKYTRKLLIQTLDIHCKFENQKMKKKSDDDGEKEFVSAFDFVYLPIDFNRRVNGGFAFVNFTKPEAALRFRDTFDGKRWNLFDSSKVAEISRARIQGKRDLITNFKGMDFSYGSVEDMPVWFSPARDGSGDGFSRMFTVGKSLY